MWHRLRCAALLGTALLTSLSAGAATVTVGSKNFSESYLLAEMAAQLLEHAGFDVERRFGLGGTLICYQALTAGEIDLYMEYTGTLSQAILDMPVDAGLDDLRTAIEPTGLRLLEPLGFDNTYALAMKRERARTLGIERIGDLRAAPRSLELVFSHEFVERGDGWPGLARAYDLNRQVTGIEHGLAYQALDDGAIDVTDAYSTDGEVVRYDLTLLADDRGFFPEYLAVPMVRADAPDGVFRALEPLGGRLDDDTMQALNAEVVFEKRSFAAVANDFLAEAGLVSARDHSGVLWSTLWRNTVRHLQLTAAALAASVSVALVLALAVFRHRMLARGVIYFCGLLQTIPSIALLALMIPLFGIGLLPAIVAVPLLVAADPAQYGIGADHGGPHLAARGRGHGHDQRRAAALRVRAAVAAEYAGRHPHRRGDQYRHRDAGCLHRRRRARRPHRHGAGLERHRPDPPGRGPGGGPRHRHRARLRGDRAAGAAGASAAADLMAAYPGSALRSATLGRPPDRALESAPTCSSGGVSAPAGSRGKRRNSTGRDRSPRPWPHRAPALRAR